MKRILFLVAMLLAGLAVGGGAAYATVALLGPAQPAKLAEPPSPAFVPTGKILAPLVSADGHLAGYMQFSVAVEVARDQQSFVTARLPLLLHAINMRTYRTPMTSGPDGMLPDLNTFRKIVLDAAPEAFGAGVVKHVVVTEATPA